MSNQEEKPTDSDPQEEILSRHSTAFGGLVKHLLAEDRKEVAKLLDGKLAKINAHIANEDVDRGELMRILAELNSELTMVSNELKAYRLGNVALRSELDTLATRVEKHGERIQILEKKVG